MRLAEIKDPQGQQSWSIRAILLKTFGVLQADGTTACGNWIYAGLFRPGR